jgi:hypothetical protein
LNWRETIADACENPMASSSELARSEMTSAIAMRTKRADSRNHSIVFSIMNASRWAGLSALGPPSRCICNLDKIKAKEAGSVNRESTTSQSAEFGGGVRASADDEIDRECEREE